MADTSETEILFHCDSNVLFPFLDYIYTDTVNFSVLNFDCICQLLMLANQYITKRLEELCIMELINRVNYNNVKSTLLFSEVS